MLVGWRLSRRPALLMAVGSQGGTSIRSLGVLFVVAPATDIAAILAGDGR